MRDPAWNHFTGSRKGMGGDSRQPHPGARVHRYGCSLPGLTGFTACRRGGTGASHHDAAHSRGRRHEVHARQATPALPRTGPRCSAGTRPDYTSRMSIHPSNQGKRGPCVPLFPWMAEREGFEPSIRCSRIHTFQACSFNHSDTSPEPARTPVPGRAAKGKPTRPGGANGIRHCNPPGRPQTCGAGRTGKSGPWMGAAST